MKTGMKFLSFFLLILLPIRVSAGKYAASFLKIGVGARYLGFGGAGAAITGEVSSFYWNPAGLAAISGIKAQLMYASQFGGFGSALGSFQHGGIVLPLRGGAGIAVNWVRFAVDDIPVYPELEGRNIMQRLQNPAIRPDGTPTGYLQDSENAYFISFAKNNRFVLDLGWLYFRVPVEIPFGVNFKIIHTKLGDESASGIGFDFGAMIKFSLGDLFVNSPLGKFGLGFVLKDATKTSLSWSTRHRDSIEPEFNWGISYEQNLSALKSKLLFALGFSDIASGGVEWQFYHKLFLRAGVKDRRFTAGAGLVLSLFRIDYAFSNHDLGFLHRISADVDLGFLMKK